jgi:hypothetical protein
VVEDDVGAERADELELGRAGDAGDDGAVRLGDLHGVGADAAGGTDHEHLLAGSDASVVADRLQRGLRRDGDGSGLLERQRRRLVRQPVFAGAGVLGEAALAGAVHLVADG